jgi:hypothetical protein
MGIGFHGKSSGFGWRALSFDRLRRLILLFGSFSRKSDSAKAKEPKRDPWMVS